VVTFEADELPATAESSPIVCSNCRYCKSFESVGGAERALDTIDPASRVSGPKGSLRTLSPSEPCISISGIAYGDSEVCWKDRGLWEENAWPILSSSPGHTTLSGIYTITGIVGGRPVGPVS
jgi:hypothetical protein